MKVNSSIFAASADPNMLKIALLITILILSLGVINAFNRYTFMKCKNIMDKCLSYNLLSWLC
jgi:hypothetical protein